jgi:hypothetical protein
LGRTGRLWGGHRNTLGNKTDGSDRERAYRVLLAAEGNQSKTRATVSSGVVASTTNLWLLKISLQTSTEHSLMSRLIKGIIMAYAFDPEIALRNNDREIHRRFVHKMAEDLSSHQRNS